MVKIPLQMGHLLDDVALVARRQVRIYNGEQFHGSQLRVVGLTIHEALNHGYNLLPQILHVDHR